MASQTWYISISKAQPIVSDQEISDSIIEINMPIPDFTNLADAGKHYQKDAENLVDVLLKTLPGGTIDRILILLLEHKASLFKIPFVEENNLEL